MTDQTPSTEDVRDQELIAAVLEGRGITARFAEALAAHDREVAAKARADVLRKVATEIEQQSATEGYRTLPSEGLYAATRALDTAARNIRYRIGAGDE